MGTSEDKMPFKTTKPTSSAQVNPSLLLSFQHLCSVLYFKVFDVSTSLFFRKFLPHRIQIGKIQCRFVLHVQLWSLLVFIV